MITNTDSFYYIIENENVNEDFYEDKKLFYFGNYPKQSKYYDNTNNLVVGNMKDETWCVSINGFVGLKLKMHTYIIERS